MERSSEGERPESKCRKDKDHDLWHGAGSPAEDPDYRCIRCQGTARPLDGRPQREVQVRPDKLEVVASFCYLGDMLSAAGGCELSTATCVKTTWKKFRGAVKTAFDIQVNGKRGPGRPKMTWKQLTERDRREWKLSAIDPHDRDTWRSGVRSALGAASQLPGRGPAVVDMAPVPAC